eukprot:5903911-Alexandrium_andersonii.AAC.1
MSASLVGSEMCIRDSGLCEDARATGLWKPPHAPTKMKQVLQMFATVSYTHLTLPTICSV